MGRLIAYGDIHGCFDEFMELRNTINPTQEDTEVCVGDIITKGHHSIKTLRYIRSNNILSVLGNHEDKIIRHLKPSDSRKQNPIMLDEDEQNIVNELTSEDYTYLKSLPLFLRFDGITIVHGGIQNNTNLDNLTNHDRQRLLRLRYLDQNGNFISLGNETKDSVFWADAYDGRHGFVVYGHQWFEEPKINTFSIGIDTGCAYGNKLSAAVFENQKNTDYKILSVNSSTKMDTTKCS